MPDNINNSVPVQILLSTYNGSAYIQQQLDSIINQSYTNWKLCVRDDGSVDDTLQKIHQYQQKDKRINVIKDDKGNVGAAQSFGLLLEQADNISYTMFADQDDVWMNNKIEVTLNEMLRCEQQSSAAQPILVYTNFIYVDETLQPIKSKKNYAVSKIKDLGFNHLLAQNPAYGCTMMLNAALKKLIKNIPAAAENHDYWIALTASAFGNIIYLPAATVWYRQHQQNLSGQHDNNSFIKRFKRVVGKKNMKDVQVKLNLAMAFKKNYGENLNHKQLGAIDNFILLSRKKSLSLFIKNWKNGLKRQTLIQTILFYLSILFFKSTVTKVENRY